MTVNDPDPIISFLLQEQLVSAAELPALEAQSRQMGESLLGLLKRTQRVTEEQATRVVAAAHRIEFVNLSPETVEPMAAHLVSQELARRHGLIPLKIDGSHLLVAMSAPLDLRARDEVELKTGYRVIPVAAAPQAVHQAIHYHFDVANATRQAIASMRLERGAGQEIERAEEQAVGPVDTGDDPITKLVGSVIRGAIDARASDIHIEPQTAELRIRYRVDGMLRSAVDLPLSAQAEVVSHIKILAQMDISEKRVPQDGHIPVRHEGREYDLRVSSLPAVGGEKIVLRILDKNAGRWSLDEVVTLPEDNQKFRELAANPYGMLLLTGPTGCGKTTTLYSVLQLVNTPQRNVVTVEDPVEYRLPGITQVQVRPVAGMTFASALRSILRQDPDIILIGEIRDLETAEIAISAALTGHLVLSTLHTNDAAGAISRLINIGVPPFLVASALLGAVAQRLMRTVCPRCREGYTPDGEELERLGERPRHRDRPQLCRGTGCHSCYQTGYEGRKAIFEILPVSATVRRLIVDGCSDTQLKEQAMAEGMRTLRQNAIEEVLRGGTTVDELMRVVDLRRE